MSPLPSEPTLPHPIPPGHHRTRALGALSHTSNSHWRSVLHMVIFHGLQNHCRWWLQPWNKKTLTSWKKSYEQPAAAAAAKSLQSCPTLRPQRRQPTRLPRPWDSPGKNTGVGCHFLLQCMKVKRESEVAQLCPTLHDPMDCSLPGSSVHGIF